VKSASRRRWKQWIAWSAAAVAASAGIAYVLFTGPKDLSRYPAGPTSPYKLPYPAGVTYLCIQSNRGIVSHRGWEEFAFDFKMPVGSDVCAARAGKVLTVTASHDGNGFNAPNNRVVIEHEDRTRGAYLHIQKNGSLVRAGEWVKQGQTIARSGNVGRSMAPHLHFHVSSPDNSGTLPISFADVADDSGVPRMFRRYTSGNTPP
jgi:murein DD-endopeptidase MepM/ murein hydrolase activator NlpD